MKIIYKARDIIEAHIVSGMLNANGIETHVSGYYLQGGVGDIAVYDFANVQIFDHDAALAQPLITQYEGAQTNASENSTTSFSDEDYIAT